MNAHASATPPRTAATTNAREPSGRGDNVHAIGRAARSTFAALGVVLSGALIAGFMTDVRNIDHTSGGYEAPYTDWTGTPIDWSAGSVSATGIRGRGYVFDTLVDCTTGMVSFELFRQRIDYRPVSPRAIAVHKPREACRERGFDPRF